MLSTMSRFVLYLLTTTCIIQRTIAEPPTNGVRASNVLGGLQQHASFSFVRPGLTQTAFAFNGPSSHQAFTSSIGDPHLAQRVQPSLAQALAYRNPGLGFASYGNGPISTAYASGAPNALYQQQYYQQPQQQHQLNYLQQQQQYQQALLAYQQQFQQPQPYYHQSQQQFGFEESNDAVAQQQQAHHAQLLASRFSSQQHPAGLEAVPEQIQLQQEQQQQQQEQPSANLLGVAYSPSPSVAHVKVSGNGYKFDF